MGSDPRTLASSRVAIPALTERNTPFWTGGANGELLIAHCQTCGWWLHPPLPVCRRCRGRDIRPEAVSGLATVWSFTVNRYEWSPGLTPPYVIAEVELAEQNGLRLLTSIVDTDEVSIGLQVRVHFEAAGAVWVPVFRPVSGQP
jgi:uncharacterized OB-fold protein